MSVIGKTPFIHSILGSLDASEMTTLKSLVDSLGTATNVDLFGPNTITSSNIGVTHVIMGLEEFANIRYDGILCYHDASHCALFVINDSLNEMQAFSINPSTKAYQPIHEHLTAEEFRRVLDDTGEHGGDEWADTMRNKLTYDATNQKIVSEKDMKVKGSIELFEPGLVNTTVGYINYNQADYTLDITSGNTLGMSLTSGLSFDIKSTGGGSVNIASNGGTVEIGDNSTNFVKIKGKTFPAYPSDTGSFTLKCVNGELQWVAD